MQALQYHLGCDNSPRKSAILAYYEALYKRDSDFLHDFFHDKLVVRDMYGITHDNPHTYIRDFVMAIKPMETIEIGEMITHGPLAAVKGVFIFKDETKRIFCDVFTFVSAGKHKLIGLDCFGKIENR